MNRNEDSQFEELIERMKRDHHEPPETPRERMWSRIDAARAERRTASAADDGLLRPAYRGRGAGGTDWWRLAAAAVAFLVLGVAVGRMLPGGDRGPAPIAETIAPVVETPAPVRDAAQAGNEFYRLTATRLFGRADALLTDFRTAGCDPQDMAPVPGWAQDMLIQTRLLLGASGASGAAVDDPLRDLLMDLELVLVQISGLEGEDCRQATEWIREGMKQRSTVERLRLMAADRTPERPL